MKDFTLPPLTLTPLPSRHHYTVTFPVSPPCAPWELNIPFNPNEANTSIQSDLQHELTCLQWDFYHTYAKLNALYLGESVPVTYLKITERIDTYKNGRPRTHPKVTYEEGETEVHGDDRADVVRTEAKYTLERAVRLTNAFDSPDLRRFLHQRMKFITRGSLHPTEFTMTFCRHATGEIGITTVWNKNTLFRRPPDACLRPEFAHLFPAALLPTAAKPADMIRLLKDFTATFRNGFIEEVTVPEFFYNVRRFHLLPIHLDLPVVVDVAGKPRLIHLTWIERTIFPIKKVTVIRPGEREVIQTCVRKTKYEEFARDENGRAFRRPWQERVDPEVRELVDMTIRWAAGEIEKLDRRELESSGEPHLTEAGVVLS